MDGARAFTLTRSIALLSMMSHAPVAGEPRPAAVDSWRDVLNGPCTFNASGRMNIGRSIFQGVAKEERRRVTYQRLQYEAASRHESKPVQTPSGVVWMSPIEFKLYEAMLREKLNPLPQFCVEGYYVDFAFPDIRMAVEADGAAYHGDDRRQRDRKRDWILRKAGWTVKRFYGTTIHHKAGNCAYVIRREVEAHRAWAIARARQMEMERQARRDAILRPFRKIAQFLKRIGRR